MEKFNNRAGGIPALTDEERLLISRATELSARCDYQAVASCFLTPREQRLLHEAGADRGGFFFGGARGAVRRKLIFLPSWMEAEQARGGIFSGDGEEKLLAALDCYGSRDMISEFCVPVHLKASGYESLSHRDWLGSLMALGIKRETVGDICFYGGEAYVFAEPKAARFITMELSRAGRDRVSAEIGTLPDGFCIENDFEPISSTVASPRLDGVIRALCSISREDAADIVEAGYAELNYFTELKTDASVSDGDIISVRGQGKFIIDSCSQMTKKGRFRLTARKFI